MTLRVEQQAIIDKILSKDWSELEALEANGYVLFPDVLHKRRRDGTWEEQAIALRVPREPDLRSARLKARAWAKEIGLDPMLDPDLFDNMDSMALLAICVRNISPPHEPWMPDPLELERAYDKASLDALWAKLDAYRTVIDPRPDGLTEEQTIGLIAAVAKTRTIVPLAAFGGASQTHCVVSMACRLVNSPDSKS